ncbi:MAG: integrase/recombinase XerC, partial [Bacteroidota bacterium]|nr:integrase/recombinase XerC [Bacteroidota bacterium]
MELELAINRFLNFCRTEKAYSQHTLLSYETALSQFREYIKFEKIPDNDISGYETDDIRPFLGWLHDKEYGKSSLRLKIVAVKSFFRYCAKKGFITNNPSSLISSPKR